jgi:hypothetical protein
VLALALAFGLGLLGEFFLTLLVRRRPDLDEARGICTPWGSGTTSVWTSTSLGRTRGLAVILRFVAQLSFSQVGMPS